MKYKGNSATQCCVLGLLLFAISNGCSVGMALSGKKNPDLSVARVGATRGEVELQLGPPVKTVTLDDSKRLDQYEYEIGNEPSAGRAIGHGVLDVLTIGLWEIAGTPIEAVQGEKYSISITYDKADVVVSVNRSMPPPSTSAGVEKVDEASATATEKQGSKTAALKLKELQEMQQAGLISEIEYKEQKSKILDEFSSK